MKHQKIEDMREQITYSDISDIARQEQGLIDSHNQLSFSIWDPEKDEIAKVILASLQMTDPALLEIGSLATKLSAAELFRHYSGGMKAIATE